LELLDFLRVPGGPANTAHALRCQRTTASGTLSVTSVLWPVVAAILAVPVAPRDAIHDLSSEADDIVCLATPEPFFAVGAHYRNFAQTTDAEVVDLLRKNAARHEPAETHT
jgi:predicted phosphoribosyltransferase